MACSNSSDYDESSSSNNYISYGPIRYFSRKGQAPTLSTGRKSKFEELHGEELLQREYRREKNRLLSKKLKEKREHIENELIEQINQLEREQEYLSNRIELLKSRKDYLYRKLEDVKRDPVFNLLHQTQYTLFFEEYDHSSLDTMSLISTLTQ